MMRTALTALYIALCAAVVCAAAEVGLEKSERYESAALEHRGLPPREED